MPCKIGSPILVASRASDANFWSASLMTSSILNVVLFSATQFFTVAHINSVGLSSG
jgi:hypothetical protein